MVCLLPTSSVQTAAQLRASLRDCETVGQYHKALDQALQVMMPPPFHDAHPSRARWVV